MTVLDCLKSLTLSAVGNDDRMLRNKFVVVCKCPRAGTLLTVKCSAPGTHRETNARGLPGEGMLAVGIDLHISVSITCIIGSYSIGQAIIRPLVQIIINLSQSNARK